ncbi:MAG: DMT family transporter [Pseudomonadota bacterium]|nr:DMT family transporter [Pseudomonadota bacterium]
MLVAAFCFALMGLLVKLAGNTYSSTELVFYRSLFGLIGILVMAGPRLRRVATPHWRLHLLRSVFGILSLWLYFVALTRLPLATAVTLNYTSPLFLALVSIGLLGERARPMVLFALALGFVGVVMLLKPHLEHDQLGIGLVGLVSGLCAGLAYANVRAMGALREPEWRIVLYFTGMSTLLSGVTLLAAMLWVAPGDLPPIWLPPPPRALHWQGLPLLIGVGLFALAGQLCMTRAYKTGTLWIASNFAYSAIVFSSLLGVLFHGDWLSPLAWAGMAVIILAGILAGWSRDHARPARAA